MKRPYFKDWTREEIIEHIHEVMTARQGIGRQITLLEIRVFKMKGAKP